MARDGRREEAVDPREPPLDCLSLSSLTLQPILVHEGSALSPRHWQMLHESAVNQSSPGIRFSPSLSVQGVSPLSITTASPSTLFMLSASELGFTRPLHAFSVQSVPKILHWHLLQPSLWIHESPDFLVPPSHVAEARQNLLVQAPPFLVHWQVLQLSTWV